MLKTQRTPTYPIHELILNRWSPRAMTGETIKKEILMSFFEAGRWAPSSMNNQLVRFVYTTKNSEKWADYFNLLMEGNKDWCSEASALIIVISRKKSYYKDRSQKTHAFEAGAASENLMLEASSQEYVAHAIGGFDREAAHKYLNLNDDWNVEVMIAVGKYDEEKSKIQGVKPSDRIPLEEIVFEDKLPDGFE